MSKPKRSYSWKTLKTLFALSGNQCAYPECAFPIIGPATEKSGDIVIGEISHIYALSEDGPRWKPGLTNKELNSPENLILFCPNHHTIVDDQPETYPAEPLVEWKREHEAKIRKRPEDVNSDSFSRFQVLTELVDQKIEEELKQLRESLFFAGHEYPVPWLEFADKLATGKLSWGTDAVRSRALAWCARVLSLTKKDLEKAEEYLGMAKSLETCEEAKIAEAFIRSSQKDQKGALKILGGIDSPMSRGAALIILSRGKEGSKKAVNWFNDTGIDTTDIDSYGKYFLLENTLELADWDKAREHIDELTDEDLHEVPAFHYIKAVVHLLTAVPEDRRAILRRSPPFEEADFRLASNTEDVICERREAREHFAKASEIAEKLPSCSGAAKMCEEYALWLELSDPETLDEGKRRLENRLRCPETALHLVRLAIRFQINLDLKAVEKEIEKQKALHHEITYDAVRARCAIIFMKKTPEDRANYIEQYEDEMARYSSKKSLQILKIKMFSEAGLLGRANECLDVLKEEGLSDAEYSHIRDIMIEAGQDDQVEIAKKHFGKTGSPNDLIILVNELGAQSKWDDVCEYGRILFEKTGAVVDAERLATAMKNAERDDQLVEFLESNTYIRAKSEKLRILYCLALYSEGELLRARSELKKLKDQGIDDETCRALRKNIALFMGDWTELSGIVADEYAERKEKSAQDLIEVAQMAVLLNLPGAKDLTIKAAEKGLDDAEVLTIASFLASSAGWSDDERVPQWLEKAVSLSGDDGPVRVFTLEDLKDFLEESSRRDQQAPDIARALTRGEVPMFLADQFLNISLFELILLPALKNPSEKDPRRRKTVPAYSGTRPSRHINAGGTVGIDVTALITLDFLGLLDKVLDAFDTVYVAHLTLAWLFREKFRAMFFHQPSLIKNAREAQKLLGTKMLEELVPSAVPDHRLSDQVGNDLAVLIAEAENTEEEGDVQRVVVRSAPVYQPGSRMKKKADLAEHAHVMVSCESVVRKLRQNECITEGQEKKAYDYLRPSETAWPDEPEISDRAILYLDDSSTMKFLHLGILEELKPAGFRPFVSQRTVSTMNSILSYESVYDKVNDTIEHIRTALNSRIESGKVRTARQFIDEQLEQPLREHPTGGMFALKEDCDAIIVDDRFFNKLDCIDADNAEIPVFSTLDILDTWGSSGFISLDRWRECRTALRRAGYSFIPAVPEELQHHLGASKIKDGKVNETLHLKAVRENILCAQMNDWLQLPGEWVFVDISLAAFIQAIRDQWTAGADTDDAARVRSDWVIDRVNVKGWIQHLGHKRRNDMSGVGFATRITAMLLPPTDAPKRVEEEYWKWFESRILTPVKEQHPDLYSWIIEWYRKEVSKYAEEYWATLTAETGGLYDKTALAKEALDIVPPLLRNALLAEQAFREEYKIEAEPLVSFENPGVSFQGSELFGAVRNILSGSPAEEVTDTEGGKWKLKNASGNDGLPNLVLHRDDKRFFISPSFASLSPDAKMRLRFLDEAASSLSLSSDAIDAWREILKERALEDNEFGKLDSEFIDAPARMTQIIHREFAGGRAKTSSLIPSSRRYFDKLLGRYDGSSTVRDYAKGGARMFFRELSKRQPYAGFLSSLFLSSHPALTAEIRIDDLGEDGFLRACDFLEKHGDRLSQLGAVEVGLRVFSSMPGIEASLVRLVKRIRDDGTDGTASGFKLFSGLLLLADGELSRLRVFSSEPPFYRRLAALSQAALIHRQLADSNVDVDRFHDLLVTSYGWSHYLQSLVDMRLEPLWSPVCWSGAQIKEIFLARIAAATKKHMPNIKNEELLGLISDIEPENVSPAYRSINLLDGGEEHLQDLPAEISKGIHTQIAGEESGRPSFTALLNSTRLFRIDSTQGDLAAEALRRESHLLADMENKSQLLQTLEGLAMVAAIVKSHALADELRVVSRRYRNYAQYDFSINEETMICLMAAASRSDLNDWTEFVGDWTTELAFCDMKNDEAEVFRSHLQYLCHVVHDLWATCGKAHAALTSRTKDGSFN